MTDDNSGYGGEATYPVNAYELQHWLLFYALFCLIGVSFSRNVINYVTKCAF
jgi:hypothetical protein